MWVYWLFFGVIVGELSIRGKFENRCHRCAYKNISKSKYKPKFLVRINGRRPVTGNLMYLASAEICF